MRISVVRAVAILLSLSPLAVNSADAVTIHVFGYSSSPFVSTTVSGADDIELDGAGNLYICGFSDIRKITPGASQAPWSTAPVFDIALSDNGTGYGVGRSLCHCIETLSENGSYSTLRADTLDWTYIAVGRDGSVYSNIAVGVGQGLYSVEPLTGTPHTLVSGGPGVGGTGYYRAMIVGPDSKLYACGASDQGQGLFRLDGNQFTPLTSWPHGGIGLAQDNQGIFYTSLTTERSDGSAGHEVWMFDPAIGTPQLLADGLGPSSSVAYDHARNILYVLNGSSIYAIAKSSVPTHRETWSAVKSRFR